MDPKKLETLIRTCNSFFDEFADLVDFLMWASGDTEIIGLIIRIDPPAPNLKEMN